MTCYQSMMAIMHNILSGSPWWLSCRTCSIETPSCCPAKHALHEHHNGRHAKHALQENHDGCLAEHALQEQQYVYLTK